MASEFATKPVAFVVCDVSTLGSLDAFAGMDAAAAERELLFREVPIAREYGQDHASFRDVLESAAPVIDLADLVSLGDAPTLKTNPNHVFTRDSAITFPTAPDVYVRARMAEPLRRPETAVMSNALDKLGHNCIAIPPDDVLLEGGDVIPFEVDGRRVVLVGYGPRSSESAMHFLAKVLIPDVADEVVGLPLARWRMNLDGGFLPIRADLAIVEPSSFDRALVTDGRVTRSYEFVEYLAGIGMHTIDVTRPQSIFSQACNAACLGNDALAYYDLAPESADALRAHGMELSLVPGQELVKGRGGPRCMSRPIYRDGTEVQGAISHRATTRGAES